jgi:hypothetical protein
LNTQSNFAIASNIVFKVASCLWISTFSFFFCNSEVNAGFFYKTAEERAKLVAAERKFTDDKVQKVIDFKKKVSKNHLPFIFLFIHSPIMNLLFYVLYTVLCW